MAVPVFSVLLFAVYDIIRRLSDWNDPTFQWIVFPEAVLILPGMLIIVAAYIPLFTLERVERRLFTPMAFTVCFALVGSMLPIVFKRIGVDPGIASSPFVATFVDVTGIVIYFTIATVYLL